jgi:hypothetical protein
MSASLRSAIPPSPAVLSYDAFSVNRDGWSLFTIGAFDTPNLAGLDLESLLALNEDELDQNVRPYLTARR